MKKSVLFLAGIICVSLLCGTALSGCGEAGDSTSPGTNNGGDNTGGNNNPGGNNDPSGNNNGGNNNGDNNQGTDGIYVGLIKFAGDATDLTGGAPILLDSSGKNTLISELNNNYDMATQAGTALAYAVHKALANLKSNDTKYPANLDSVNIVTFTDGYDISSVTWSSRTGNSIEGKTFSTDPEYIDYVKTEIANRKIAEKPVTAYSVGIVGKDVEQNYTRFQTTLQNIASAGKSKELTNFDEVQSTFNDIADGLNVVHTNTDFVLVTAGLTNGTKVRMTFDVTSTNPTSAEAEASTKYIEGVYNFDSTTQTDTFTNITYAGGIASDAGTGPITGTINGTEVNFTFNGITGYDPDQDGPKTKQWLMLSDMTSWQINSEYDSGDSSVSTVEKRSSIIYLVLDCSTSLKINEISQIPQIRSAAIDFINSLYNQYNSGSGGNNNGNNGGNNNGGNNNGGNSGGSFAGTWYGTGYVSGTTLVVASGSWALSGDGHAITGTYDEDGTLRMYGATVGSATLLQNGDLEVTFNHNAGDMAGTYTFTETSGGNNGGNSGNAVEGFWYGTGALNGAPLVVTSNSWTFANHIGGTYDADGTLKIEGATVGSATLLHNGDLEVTFNQYTGDMAGTYIFTKD